MAELKIKWTNLERVLNEFYNYFVQQAKDNLAGNGSIASNDLYNSLSEVNKVIEIGDDYFSVKINMLDYWKYVEEGTSPHYPPIKPLLDWVAVKQGVPKVEGFAYAVQNKIAKEGTEAKPFFEPAKEDAIKRFELSIDYAIDEDVNQFILDSVDGYLMNKFREI